MVLYYAMGGGLGHLTRAVGFLDTLSLGDHAVIITSSSWAEDPRVIKGHRAIRPPASLEDDREGFASWIQATIAAEKPARVIIDSFPAGILGELSGLTSEGRYELWLVSRLLNWSNYEKRLEGRALPEYDVVWQIEPLHSAHEEALRRSCREFRKIDIVDPKPSLGVPEIEGRHWLVVHSGPAEEVEDLLRYAIEMRKHEKSDVPIVLVSPFRPQMTAPFLSMIDVFPAWPLFEHAERVISAAGSNVMRQMARYRKKHRFVPFPRALDDQYTRASRARERR